MDSSDQAKIFVGGISWETTEEKLKDHFNGFGEVVESVIMKDKATGRGRGFGFVAFADLSVVDKVLLGKHSIDGRVVEVKRAVPRDEQQNLSKSNNGGPISGDFNRTKKIFVGGLASTVKEDDFRNYFSQFGNIADVVVMYDPSTQRPRGFGFITFDSEDAVEKVIQQKTFHEIHDKTVEVKKAVPREVSAGRTGGAGFGSGRGASYNSGYGQGSNASSGSTYGGPQHTSPSAGRGGFPSYGLASYGTPGYGAAPGYGMPMNGAYGGAAYGSGAGYASAGAYGAGYVSAPPVTGYGGYVAPLNAPSIGPRSPWGSSAVGYTGTGSPAAYGAGGAAATSGYGAPGWNTGGAPPQANGGNTGYNTSGYGHGTNVSTMAGYNDRSMAPVAVSEAGGGAGYAGAFGSGPVTDAAGYGVAGRQAQRGPDTRFRPYPTAGECVP